MPCAYKNGYNFECQFDFQEDELMDVDGNQWCPFHAPLKDEGKNPTEKGKWTDEKTWQFYKKILKLRESTLADIGKRLNLRGVIFPGKAYFQGLEFPEVDFSDAKFKGDADFSDSTFRGSVYFRKVKFYGHETTFRKARFEKSTDFRKAKFIGGNADFSEARFMDEEIYGGGNFFSKTKFNGGDANFRKAKFKKDADFKKTEFRWSAIFSEVQFNAGAIFNKAKFNWSALFQNAHFRGDACFQKTYFEGRADFTSPGENSDIDAFQNEVHFDDAEFLDEVSFNNRKFRQESRFKNCTFHKAPRFHSCSLHQDTDFTDAKFLDRQGNEATRAYRTLKLDMENKRARQEQLMFYALEMESSRRKGKKDEEKKEQEQKAEKKVLNFISIIYELTADYGQSIIRPFVSVLAVFVVSMIIYAILFLVSPIADCKKTDIVILTSRSSAEQIAFPFWGVGDSSSISKCIEQVSPSNLWRLCLGITTKLQSGLSIVFLGLGALAIRWRFKIG